MICLYWSNVSACFMMFKVYIFVVYCSYCTVIWKWNVVMSCKIYMYVPVCCISSRLSKWGVCAKLISQQIQKHAHTAVLLIPGQQQQQQQQSKLLASCVLLHFPPKVRSADPSPLVPRSAVTDVTVINHIFFRLLATGPGMQMGCWSGAGGLRLKLEAGSINSLI